MLAFKRAGFGVLVLGVLIAAGSIPAAAQDASKDVKSSKGRGKADAKDPNIKDASEANKPDANTPPPAKKAPADASKSRQGVCQVHVDNRTALIIKVFVDGTYRGAVGPWDDLFSYTEAGPTRLYARADFTDGTYIYFGPDVVPCNGTYTWRLFR